MSKKLEYRSLVDEYGEVTQRRSARGNWVNVSRTMNGVTFMLDGERKTVDYALALKAGGVDLRLNEMSDKIEVRGELADIPDGWEPLTDVLLANLTNFLLDVGLIGKDRMIDVINTVGWRNRYHPVQDYLQGLEWDGENHLDRFLSHFKFVPLNEGVGQIFFRRWLIGAVAKIMCQGQNFMLVLDGPQGIGKSYLARWLCPLPGLFLESAVNPEDKDSYKRLMSYWIWEVGELEGTTRKSDRAALKDFITRRDVTVRVPYGRLDITKPASASLLGTINDDGAGFLNDTTGNRRYAVMSLETIDYAYADMDVNQLWAHVYHLYEAGEPWELQPHERILQNAVNELYEADSPVEEHLRHAYTWDLQESNNLENFVPSVEILETLKMAGLRGNDRANLMEISSILKREGLVKKRFQGLTGFFGMKKSKQPAHEYTPIYGGGG